MSDGLTRNDLATPDVSENKRRDKDARYRLCVVQCLIPLSQSRPDEGPVGKMIV